jgi:cell wall assembly regulator SMI1
MFDYRTHVADVPLNDGSIEGRVREFQKAVDASGRANAYLTLHASPAELKRARYIHVGGRSVDEDKSVPTLNEYPRLCNTCRWPDLGQVCEPFYVTNEPRRRSKEDVFFAQPGLLIVRLRVLEILRQAIGDQFESGPAHVVGEKPDTVDPLNALSWVRPLRTIGPEEGFWVAQCCVDCRRTVMRHLEPTQYREGIGDYRLRGFQDYRHWLETFDSAEGADFARIDGFYGYLKTMSPFGIHFSLAMSGALLAHLQAHKVRGIFPARRAGEFLIPRKPGERWFNDKVTKFASPSREALEALTPKPEAARPPVDPADTRRAVTDSWRRIEAWLKIHAPRIFDALAPGATAAQIAAAERKLRFELPEDVRMTYLIHNGAEDSDLLPSPATLPPEMAFSLLPLDEIVRDFREMRQWDGWSKHWLPIAHNGGGDYLCVDLNDDKEDPNARGRIIEYQHELSDFEVVSPSLRHLLQQLSDGMDRGRCLYDEDDGIVWTAADQAS